MTAEAEIRALVERYAELVDARRFGELDTVFVADGVLETPQGRREGRAAIQTAMGGLERYVSTDHRVGASHAVVDDVHATGEVACEAHHVSAGPDGTNDRIMTITYHDRYVRTVDGWRIEHRRLQLDAETTVPVD